jgi:hypothetical protein
MLFFVFLKRTLIHERQIVNKHIKRCSTWFFIRELQIKIAIRYHCPPIRMSKIQRSKTVNTSYNKYGENADALLMAWKVVHPLWKPGWCFLTKLNMLLSYYLANHTFRYLFNWFENLCPLKNLYMNVYLKDGGGGRINGCQGVLVMVVRSGD